MRIKAVADYLGVSVDWLRRQEKTGLVPAPLRDRNGHRRYSGQDIELLRSALFDRTPDFRRRDHPPMFMGETPQGNHPRRGGADGSPNVPPREAGA